MGAAYHSTKFTLYIEPQVFLNRVQYDTFLRRQAENATAFIGAKDVSVLFEENGGLRPSLEVIEESTLVGLLRSARNPKGLEIYSNANITQGVLEPIGMVGYQTFVELSNIANLHSLSNFFRGSGFRGISNAPPCILSYSIGGENYKAIYLPPIVEIMPKERFSKALSTAQARLDNNEELEIQSVDEAAVKTTLKEFVQNARSMIENSVNGGIQEIVDGTHRATSASISGALINYVRIEGSTKVAPGIPINLRDVIFAKEKPLKRQDRFLGLDEEGWTSLKEIGVDG